MNHKLADTHAPKIPKDQVKQWEIACLYHLQGSMELIQRGFKHRLEAGATVEPGPYALDPSSASADEIVKEEGYGLARIGTQWFDDISYTPTDS